MEWSVNKIRMINHGAQRAIMYVIKKLSWPSKMSRAARNRINLTAPILPYNRVIVK